MNFLFIIRFVFTALDIRGLDRHTEPQIMNPYMNYYFLLKTNKGENNTVELQIQCYQNSSALVDEYIGYFSNDNTDINIPELDEFISKYNTYSTDREIIIYEGRSLKSMSNLERYLLNILLLKCNTRNDQYQRLIFCFMGYNSNEESRKCTNYSKIYQYIMENKEAVRSIQVKTKDPSLDFQLHIIYNAHLWGIQYKLQTEFFNTTESFYPQESICERISVENINKICKNKEINNLLENIKSFLHEVNIKSSEVNYTDTINFRTIHYCIRKLLYKIKDYNVVLNDNCVKLVIDFIINDEIFGYRKYKDQLSAFLYTIPDALYQDICENILLQPNGLQYQIYLKLLYQADILHADTYTIMEMTQDKGYLEEYFDYINEITRNIINGKLMKEALCHYYIPKNRNLIVFFSMIIFDIIILSDDEKKNYNGLILSEKLQENYKDWYEYVTHLKTSQTVNTLVDIAKAHISYVQSTNNEIERKCFDTCSGIYKV